MKHKLMTILLVLFALLLPVTATAQNAFFSTTPNPAFAAPNVIVSIEPFNGTSVLFSPLAAHVKGGPQESLVVLSLKISNQEKATVTLSKVKVSFSGNPQVADTIYNTSFSVQAGKTATLDFGHTQNIRVPFPAPPSIKIELTFNGFTPLVVSKPLVAHANPVPQGSYLFPAKSGDLLEGEYWGGSSGHKAGGTTNKPPEERLAYDMGVAKKVNGEWTGFHTGKTGTANSDYLVWEKPIYAMADGVVLSCVQNKKDNPPGTILSGSSNNFVIQHGNERALYLHMRENSAVNSLCTPGAIVKAGDKLGLVGNSGNSTAPHLHVQVTTLSGEMRPLLFRNIHLVERASFTGIDSPWVNVQDKGLPYDKNAIWPSATKPQPNCSALQGDLQGLKKEVADLQADLKEASPSQKPHIAAQIKAIQAQIAALKDKMEELGCQPTP
jgi:murein DD-endopeptidase MepM/ murein hydrolase activator NlpD